VDEIKLKFKVDKEWINDNNINQTKIYLLRYNDNRWRKLATIETGSDTEYLYYESTTPGFSTFAILGETKTSESIISSLSENIKDTKEKFESLPEEEKKKVYTSGIVLFALTLILQILIVFAGYRLWVSHRRKSENNRTPFVGILSNKYKNTKL